MKNCWKRLAAILGAAVLVVSQNEVIPVHAEELPAEKEAPLQESGAAAGIPVLSEGTAVDGQAESEDEADPDVSVLSEGTAVDGQTKAEDEATTDISALSEAAAADGQAEAESAAVSEETENAEEEILPATNLRWDSETPGYAYFDDPNEEGKAYFVGKLYLDGEYQGYQGTTAYEGKGYLYFFEQMEKTGTYEFVVDTINMADGKTVATSERVSYTYTKPEHTLSTPEDISWSQDGIFICKWSQEEYVDSYGFRVCDASGNQLGNMFGSNYVFSKYGNLIEISDGYMKFNLNGYMAAEENVTVSNGFTVYVRTTSSDIEQAYHSDYVSVTFNDGSGSSSSSSEETSSHSSSSSDEASSSASAVVIEEWKPRTPDEIKRYAAYSREKVNYTADEKNAYAVTVQNAMQGKMCYDSFEAVLGDWVMGRTYNIYPSGKSIYKMDSKARITLDIPKTLQADGREFKMICVTEKGLPVVLKDMDSDQETITFETDVYYAFALIYKDTAAAK